MLTKLLLACIGLTAFTATAACSTEDALKVLACLAKKGEGETDVCVIAQASIDCSMENNCYTSDECDAAVKLMEGTCDGLSCGGCFPASATVELENGKTTFMDQLAVGDKVRVGPAEFSEVYFFSTNMVETSSKFVKISTDSTELSLTAGHYLYANGKQVQARSVEVGDIVVLANGTKAEVITVDSFWGSGLYNPHTLHGDILVDGVLTTTYTDAVHPKLSHALLSPLRALYSAGVSFGEGFSTVTKGLPSWVLKAIKA